MNILYLSCHAILEYDEIKLFTEMGHNVFSMGAYQVNNSDNHLRPAIPGLYHNEHLVGSSLRCNKENLHPEIVEWCDVVISMHNSRVQVEDHPQPWIANNWEKFKKAGKPVIWRSIGQSTREIEKSLQKFRKEGLKIVRYSPREESIPSYQGSDALIRFYKDPTEYEGYTGNIPRIVNVSQALFGDGEVNSRGDHMSLDFFKQCTEGLDWKVFGPNNRNAGTDHNGGSLSFDDLKNMMKFNRVYFYTGTRPASYTLALIEAMMTGIPIVSVGPLNGNQIYTDQKTFEAHEIIGESGVCGFWSDNVEEVRMIFERLINDQSWAQQIGQNGRGRAIELFGKETVRKEWEKLFDTLK